MHVEEIATLRSMTSHLFLDLSLRGTKQSHAIQSNLVDFVQPLCKVRDCHAMLAMTIIAI
jgi:hypothetical protein